VQNAWVQGKVTNLEYLLYLNFAAGRTFNDLAQWPVFPWVLKDYMSEKFDLENDEMFRDLSKPMGALGHPNRLSEARCAAGAQAEHA
jgi:factor associated with neutral sphingomyelinase activation